MIIKQIKRIFALFLASALLALLPASQAAAQGYGSGDYSSQDARRVSSVEKGKVIQIRSVLIEVEARSDSRLAGAVIAGAGCAILTRNISDWTVRGAVTAACGVGGERIANRRSSETREAWEILVLLENGRAVSVTQEDGDFLKAGDGVYIVHSRDADRVLKEY